MENERFIDQFIRLTDEKNHEVNFTTHAKLLKFQNADGATLYGILMQKSVAIPLTAAIDTDDSIKSIVTLNNFDLDRHVGEPHAQAACRLLGLPFNGETKDFYSDGTIIESGSVNVLHIYPKGFVSSQKDFLKKLDILLLGIDCSVSVEETAE